MLRLALALVVILASCGKTSISTGDTSNACTAGETKNGLICLSNQWQPKLAGMCASSADCPVPYNYCDSSNRCQVQLAQSGSKQIWFATDAMRPGINAGDSPGPAGTGYIYNIMAKGYESLDDWCMAQAQQSSLTNMRNIKSWTALIIAQPDNTLGALSETGTVRMGGLTFSETISPLAINYVPPSLGAVANNPLVIFDRNSAVLSSSGSTGQWSGMSSLANSQQPAIWICPGYGNYPFYASAPNDFRVPAQSSSACQQGTSGNSNLWGASQGNGSMSIIPFPVDCIENQSVIGFFQSGDQGIKSASCAENRYGCTPLDCQFAYTVDTSPSYGPADCGTDNGWSAQCAGEKPILCLANQGS